MFIIQKKYCSEVLKKFDMQGSKCISTLMASNVLIDKNEQGIKINITKYRGIIGSLLYLNVSGTNITVSVCMCARLQASPKEPQFKFVKNILRYLNGTLHHGLWFPKGREYSFLGFSDFAGCKLDRKNTSGTCHLFENCLVSWHSKKQRIVVLSTAETRYVATGNWLC